MQYTRNRYDHVYADKRISTTVKQRNTEKRKINYYYFLKQTQKASNIFKLPFHVQLL